MSEEIKERPILFSGEMVRAVLQGRKTQTRRVVTQAFSWINHLSRPVIDSGGYGVDLLLCPYGEPGERLWVRESWATWKSLDQCKPSGIVAGAGVQYLAGGTNIRGHEVLCGRGKGRPSIFMPRWASRILLEVESVRVERVQDVSEEDAWAEGVVARGTSRHDGEGRALFRRLWDSINKERGYGWDENPWVWVVEFRVIQKKGSVLR